MIRATTGGVLRSYRKNLMSSFIADNKARDTVLSQRLFNSFAEDPASAAKAFRVRKSRLMVKSQHDVAEDTYHKYQGAFSSLLTIDEMIDTSNGKGTAMTTLKGTTLQMLNDPEGDARVQLTKVLDQLSDSIIQNMNQKYGDNFIFAGADGLNVPFEVKTVDGHNKLYYRGVPVDAAEPNVWKTTDANGNEQLFTVNDKGQYDPKGTSYLNMDNAKVMSVNDYKLLYLTEPKVEEKTVLDENNNPVMIKEEYNADGSPMEKGDEGGYYKLKNDISEGKAGKLIPIEDYYKALSRFNNPPAVLKDVKDGNQRVTSDGVPEKAANGGSCYIVFDGDPQVISKKDYEQAKVDAEKLDYLVNEKRFIDIGLGMQEDENGKLIESSAFNESLNGLTFLGYGMDEDGDPKNIYSIVQRLKEIAQGVPDGGTWSQEVYDEFDGLVKKLENASSEFKTQFTNMDAGTQKLKNNMDLLEDNFYNLEEQTSNLEDVNMADAITSFIWAEYCYNAALKVGNSILSQSLMDYLQ